MKNNCHFYLTVSVGKYYDLQISCSVFSSSAHCVSQNAYAYSTTRSKCFQRWPCPSQVYKKDQNKTKKPTPAQCIACRPNGKALQKVFSNAVVMQVYSGCWVEPQLQRDLCGPQLSKVASNLPRLEYFGHNAPCESCEPWQQTLARGPLSRTHPNFHFLLAVDAFQNSLGGLQWCLPEPSWTLLKNVNPSVSNSFTHTVTVPVLVLSTLSDSYPGDKWLWDVQESAVLGFSFLHLQGACLCMLAAWGRTYWKTREQASLCCCGLCFSLTMSLLHRERQYRVWEPAFRLSACSRQGLSQLVVLHWKVTKKSKKHPVYVASKQLYAELAWSSNIWGLGSCFLLNGTRHEISTRFLKAKLDPSKLKP